MEITFSSTLGCNQAFRLQSSARRTCYGFASDFLLCEADFGKIVVHGHTPVREPEIRPNRINIDTGAYATGQLTCLMLEGTEKRFI